MGIMQQQIKEMSVFLKEAWCIDGECSHIGFDNLKDGTEIMMFQLTDTKRGTFKIEMAK